MAINIRPAIIEDQESIYEVIKLCLRKICIQDYNQNQIESLIRSQNSHRFVNEIIFVAEVNQKIIGFSSLVINNNQIEIGTIGSIFVHPEFTRNKIGSKLLQTLEHIAREKRYSLVIVQSSLTAVNFYQSQGYKKYKKSGFWSENKVWIPTVSLRKRLMTAKKKSNKKKSNTKILSFALLIIIIFFVIL